MFSLYRRSMCVLGAASIARSAAAGLEVRRLLGFPLVRRFTSLKPSFPPTGASKPKPIPSMTDTTLNRAIVQCRSIGEIETLMCCHTSKHGTLTTRQQWDQVSPVNVCTVFHRLGSRRTHPWQWKALRPGFRLHLVHSLEQALPFFKGRHISNCFWVFARFNGHILTNYLDEERLLTKLCIAVAENGLSFQAQEIANIIWALATVDFVSAKRDAALKVLQSHLRSTSLTYKPCEQEYSNIVWAIPKLSAIDEATTKQLVRRLPLFHHNAFTAQALSNIALGFAKAPHLTEAERKDALQNIAMRSQDRLTNFNEQGICNLCWSVASAYAEAPVLFLRVSERMMSPRMCFHQASHFVILMWSFVRVSIFPKSMFTRFSFMLRDRFHELEREDLKVLISIYSNSKVQNADFVALIHEALEKRPKPKSI